MEGIYMYDDAIVGIVEDFEPKDWFGKVTLRGMEEFAEYGSLDSGAKVDVEGKIYSCPWIANN
tara:strand:- start:1038 stop:1226 length:189 start_codon:yes stop_codon:yes gene_type:complete